MNKAAIFIFIILLSIGAFDVYLVYSGGTEATISSQIILWSYNYPAFTFLMGFAMGHLFWRMRDTKKTERLGKSGEGEE